MQRLRSLFLCQRGQTTTEYVTTLLVVVLITGALAAFVKSGGLDGMFESIVDNVIKRAQG
jgi:uncharacterized protein (UPF0333 family)